MSYFCSFANKYYCYMFVHCYRVFAHCFLAPVTVLQNKICTNILASLLRFKHVHVHVMYMSCTCRLA